MGCVLNLKYESNILKPTISLEGHSYADGSDINADERRQGDGKRGLVGGDGVKGQTGCKHNDSTAD